MKSGSWEKERRLDFIDDNFVVNRKCSRLAVSLYFRCSIPQVSLDIKDYLQLSPKIRYCHSHKIWEASFDFVSVRNSSPERIQAWGVWNE